VSDAVPSLPKHRLLVRMKPGSTDLERQRVINGLRSSVRSPLIQIQDTQALVSATDVAVLGLDLFFNFVAALALILAFFSTWLSFASNVRENSVEFGILRSLGLPAVAVIRSYCYEALTVVLTSFSLGTVVGLLVAITLTLQFNLFTEMPFSFVFPTSLFVFTLLGCIALALAASYYPARAIARMQVAGVLKGRAA
jgi:ABC-type antimicrobial peptide transport system permease subunit